MASTATRKKIALPRRVYLVGERGLVQEYALLCSAKGCIVSVRLNEATTETVARRSRHNDREAGLALPKGIRRVSRPERGTDLALELTLLDIGQKRRNLTEIDRTLGPTVPILSTSVTTTVAEQAGWVSHPGRLIGIGALPSLLSGILVELAAAPHTTPDTVATAAAFLTSLDKESALVQDSVGLVLPRIIGMLANEACFAIREGIASRADIDAAMKLGTNYPFGPIEWAERIGVEYVHAIMSALQTFYNEERYRVAPLLRQAAQLGAFPA